MSTKKDMNDTIAPVKPSEYFQKVIYQPKTALNVAWIRIILFGGFLYKLLSRDYSVFGLAPSGLLELYAHQLFPPNAGYAYLGFGWVVDLTTFHWIHWFLPFPGPSILSAIQLIAILGCIAVLLFGRGPKHLFPIITYACVAYLWGYNWRSGADVDAVFLQMQLMIVYCFFKEPEALVLSKSRVPLLQTTKENGWFYSMTLIIFSAYYFYAGINKIVDISLLDWFKYDLIQAIAQTYEQVSLGFFKQTLPWLNALREYTYLNYLLVPVCYLLELSIPIIVFNRRLIATYMVFFLLFHLMTLGVGILFFGNMLIWFALLPVHRFVQPVNLVWDSQCRFCETWINRFEALNWLHCIRFIGSAEAIRNPETIDGWTPDIVERAMWVKCPDSDTAYEGFDGFRRIAWAIPLLWPVLFFLYLPGVPLVGRMVYGWVAANRYRFDCQSTVCHRP